MEMLQMLIYVGKTTIYIFIIIYKLLRFFELKMSIINITIDNQIVNYQ